jgi:Tfp pilus assembly protein PilF
MVLIKIKKLPEALATFEQALKIDPNNSLAQQNRDTVTQQLHQNISGQ